MLLLLLPCLILPVQKDLLNYSGAPNTYYVPADWRLRNCPKCVNVASKARTHSEFRTRTTAGDGRCPKGKERITESGRAHSKERGRERARQRPTERQKRASNGPRKEATVSGRRAKRLTEPYCIMVGSIR